MKLVKFWYLLTSWVIVEIKCGTMIIKKRNKNYKKFKYLYDVFKDIEKKTFVIKIIVSWL
jgi:hypothetical protein